MASQNIRRLVETALLFAIAMILSMVKLFDMPWGGSVTLCSMLPIILISYRYGIKWGLFSGFVFSILQLLTGLSGLKGLTGASIVGSVLLDYLLAFTVLGIGGLFRNKIKHPGTALALGSVVAIFGRYLCSFASGFILWGSYAQETLESFGDGFASWVLDHFSGFALSVVYSAIYNAMYIVPEMILTVIVCFILGAVPVIGKKQDMASDH